MQGIGGALLFATGSVLLTETFREARGRAALAVWGTVTGIAVACSPLLGGEIASTIGWRWLFWLDVPVSTLALLIGFVAIKEPLLDQAARPSQAARQFPLRAGGRTRGTMGTIACRCLTGWASSSSRGPSPSS